MRVVKQRTVSEAPDHSVAEEICAKAMRLAVVAVIGVVLVGMIAVAGVYPHAAAEVRELVATGVEATK